MLFMRPAFYLFLCCLAPVNLPNVVIRNRKSGIALMVNFRCNFQELIPAVRYIFCGIEAFLPKARRAFAF